MFDPENRDALTLQGANHVGEFDHLGVGEPAGDLVQEQDTGIRGEGSSELKAFAM